MAGRRKTTKDDRDEYATRLQDVEEECSRYSEQFRDKVVFCGCDDPDESAFVEFFAKNFKEYGLKKLIATSYNPERRGHKLEITQWAEPVDDRLSLVQNLLLSEENNITLMKGDGDFRSAEYGEILAEADIMVTCPPFSLYTEFLSRLVSSGIKFLVLAPKDSNIDKDVFPWIKADKVWKGYRYPGTVWFESLSPVGSKRGKRAGASWLMPALALWVTNLDVSVRHELLPMKKHYTPEEFPSYDNYNAVEVSTLERIPADYDGIMGVPFSFLDHYNPEQFEIIGCSEDIGEGLSGGLRKYSGSEPVPLIAGRMRRRRIFIRRLPLPVMPQDT